MNVCSATAATKAGSVTGRLISLAVVLGCSTAMANDGLIGMSSDSRSAAGLVGSFSDSELQQLEHASAAAATAARVAAMQRSVAYSAPSRKWHTASTEVAAPASDNVFQHSSQLLPMLVTAPQPSPSLVRPEVTRRPGLVQTVGVDESSVR